MSSKFKYCIIVLLLVLFIISNYIAISYIQSSSVVITGSGGVVSKEPTLKSSNTSKKVVTTTTTTTIVTTTVTATDTALDNPFEFGKVYRAKVVNIIDGDTVDVLINDSTYRIRLLGVDCPEIIANRNKPYEYDNITDLKYLAEWGLKAKEYTYMVLNNKTVYVEFDELAGFKDYFGRYLAYIYLENWTDFNALLIKNGLARVYVEGSFKKKDTYLKLENYAKIHKIGFWI